MLKPQRRSQIYLSCI